MKGFKPEYLYGSNDIRPMYDLITTSGDGSININTVSRDVLEMMGTGSDVIDAIFKQRTKEIGGARQIPVNLAPAFTDRIL